MSNIYFEFIFEKTIEAEDGHLKSKGSIKFPDDWF